MRPAEMRDLSDEELVRRIKEIRTDAFGRRFQLATGELENTSSVRHTKRDLARALTIARERGIDTHNL